MRLSEAIMLGSATCKMVPIDMGSCAYGAALNALGVKSKGADRYLDVERLWPWTEAPGGMSDPAVSIYCKFDHEVCRGLMTLEQLVDYVRSIEPDCDCNRFNCDCAGRAVETEPEGLFVEVQK